jgi:hypothetical protein
MAAIEAGGKLAQLEVQLVDLGWAGKRRERALQEPEGGI